MEVLDKIIDVMKEKKVSQKSVCDMLGLKQTAFSEWKGGRSESYMKYLPQIAEYLGVSIDYLAGTEKPATESDELDRKLISLYERLSPDNKNLVLKLIEEMTSGK